MGEVLKAIRPYQKLSWSRSEIKVEPVATRKNLLNCTVSAYLYPHRSGTKTVPSLLLGL